MVPEYPGTWVKVFSGNKARSDVGTVGVETTGGNSSSRNDGIPGNFATDAIRTQEHSQERVISVSFQLFSAYQSLPDTPNVKLLIVVQPKTFELCFVPRWSVILPDPVTGGNQYYY
eukprot:41171-Rhodomonas_salina.4